MIKKKEYRNNNLIAGNDNSIKPYDGQPDRGNDEGRGQINDAAFG